MGRENVLEIDDVVTIEVDGGEEGAPKGLANSQHTLRSPVTCVMDYWVSGIRGCRKSYRYLGFQGDVAGALPWALGLTGLRSFKVAWRTSESTPKRTPGQPQNCRSEHREPET